MSGAARSLVVALALALASAGGVAGQWGVSAKAALPELPYWWSPAVGRPPGLLPLLWTNDVDGAGSGCCVIGATARYPLGESTLWFGLGFGTDGDAGAPAAVEAAARMGGGTVAFRTLHGRTGFSGLYPLYTGEAADRRSDRISVGISALWLNDERYIEPLTFFECAAEAPAVPCREVDRPFGWSAGNDHALIAEMEWGRGHPRWPRLRGSLVTGLAVVGGDHDYVRLEAEALAADSLASAELRGRLAAGWSSVGAPQQRRFRLDGADPAHRWLNPYLDVPGALLAGAPYVVPGGAGLRGYEQTAPLVRAYLAGRVELSRSVQAPSGFWGRAGAYLAGAWTPGIPDRLGPEAINENGELLFDWRELPVGEGEALGRFRARSLEVSKLWADAGVSVTGGYDRFALTIALPLWVNSPAFASEPVGGGEKKSLAVRWTFSLAFYPEGPWDR